MNFRYWIYHHIIVPVVSFFDDIRYRKVVIPPPPCQICGEPGHRERDCKKAKELGF
jgi:hypothetical protein